LWNVSPHLSRYDFTKSITSGIVLPKPILASSNNPSARAFSIFLPRTHSLPGIEILGVELPTTLSLDF